MTDTTQAEQTSSCAICGEDVDELFYEIKCSNAPCGKHSCHKECVEKYLKRIGRPSDQLSGYGCFVLREGEARIKTVNHASSEVVYPGGFLFDGGADKDWAQRPFSRDKEKRHFCNGHVEWSRKDTGKKKKAKAQLAAAPVPTKFAKHVQQQTAAAAKRLLESKMMSQGQGQSKGQGQGQGQGQVQGQSKGTTSTGSGAFGVNQYQYEEDSSWTTVVGSKVKVTTLANKDNHINQGKISNDMTYVNNQRQKKQAPAIVAPGSGAAARMGAGTSNGKKSTIEASNQTFVPGMEPEQSVAASKTKNKANQENKQANGPQTSLSEALNASANDLNRSVNALDGKIGFVSSIDRYNALIGSPLSPLSPDESIPDCDESDTMSISEMSSIQNAAPFDISSLTDEQLAHAIAYGADTLSDFIPSDAVPFVEAILQNLRDDMRVESDGVTSEFEVLPDEPFNHPPQVTPLAPPQAPPPQAPPPQAPPLEFLPLAPSPQEVHNKVMPVNQQQEVYWQQQVVLAYDQQMLESLISMGFPKNRSAHALIATENKSIDAATDFILAFEHDPSMDAPVDTPPRTGPPLNIVQPAASHAAWSPPPQPPPQLYQPIPSQSVSLNNPAEQPYQQMILQAQQHYQQLATGQPYQAAAKAASVTFQPPLAYQPPLYAAKQASPASPAPTMNHTIANAAEAPVDDDVAELLALCGI